MKKRILFTIAAAGAGLALLGQGCYGNTPTGSSTSSTQDNTGSTSSTQNGGGNGSTNTSTSTQNDGGGGTSSTSTSGTGSQNSNNDENNEHGTTGGTSSTGSGTDSQNGSTSSSGRVTAPKTVTISIKNFAFSPQAKTITKGTTVTWKNNDTTAHTVTADNGGDPGNSGNIPPGGTYSYTFSENGRFTYHCSIHPNMTGTITVR